MKKIFAIFGLLFLTGCNAQVVDFNYKYEEAYIELPTGYEEVEIKSWTDYEDSDMVQITTTDGTVYYTHGSKVVLVHGN